MVHGRTIVNFLTVVCSTNVFHKSVAKSVENQVNKESLLYLPNYDSLKLAGEITVNLHVKADIYRLILLL